METATIQETATDPLMLIDSCCGNWIRGISVQPETPVQKDELHLQVW